MTTVPAQNLSKQHRYSAGYGGYGGSFPDSLGLMNRLEGYSCSEASLGSDLVVAPMAEDESRMESINEAGSSSKDAQEEKDEGWLQLSIGGGGHTHTASNKNKKDDPQIDQSSRREEGKIELDLLPGSSSSGQLRSLAPVFHHHVNVLQENQAPRPPTIITGTAAAGPVSLSVQQHPLPATISSFPHQEINWSFRPMPRNIVAAASPSSSSSLGPSSGSGSYFTARPFQFHMRGVCLGVVRPAIDFRVIDPPRRPHSGIWFMLQVAQNQAKEPFLPQISNSFLRIKDGRMAIRLVMKYLVNKLKLESESEIEIRCRGQQVQPFLTLQHVRDSIWSPRDSVVTLFPADYSTTDHVMILHYGRSP